ncbi:uncharacterized protein ppp1r18 isoform X2 [Salarias fasciatus]|uniref:uncharacterized protein ppp1r18 isoform X2 n=1 Tax=Salarias fasciatus TaxID=181472 RepID=UPI001177039B|nr:phostensin isoform X2 [Salarias fasciatus]
MSVSSLPEWKQLLLERKRREEEERDRREKEEEQKFASMPAWKRGIIQRRKAKQESLGDRERERDVCLLQVDVRSPSDGLSDTDSSVTVNLGSEPSLSPDPGLWLDAEPKLVSQVSAETIVPVHENPFIRTQSVWRKGRDGEVGNEPEVKDKERDKLSPRAQDGEPVRGRDIELKIERFRDLSEGREKERSRDRSQGREHSRERCEKDKSQWKESVKGAVKDQEFLKVRKDPEEKDAQQQPALYSPLGPCLRTIRADNIIIIEQDRKGSDERRARWREAERERERTEEEHQGKRGMKMDLREILAGGGSVTEIRASEVLIIKPSASPEDMSAGGKGREEGEMKCSGDARRESGGREVRTDVSWLKEKEKERPWGQATVINKDDRKDSLEDNVFIERGGRVSQLLSKFGHYPKPPSRSKSSDNFLQPGSCKYLDQDEQEYEEMKADGKNTQLKGVPKRSFSFSDRVISAKENGVDDEGSCERRIRERTHSERSVTSWEDTTSPKKETTAKIKLGCARLLDKDRFGKYRDVKTDNEKRRGEAESCFQHRNEAKKVDVIDKRAAEKAVDADGDKGFTVASVKNTEGISFARRVPIRQDVRARAEREPKGLPSEKSVERAQSAEKADAQPCDAAECEPEGSILTERSHVSTASTESLSACPATESLCSHDSAFTECSSLPCTVTPQKRPDWGTAGSRGAYLAHCVLSQHTEELISKIEKIGDTTVYNSERGYKPAQEMTKQEGLTGGQGSSENLVHDVTPRSPKKMAAIGASPGPLEIQIPRTVFYVAEEMVDRKKTNEGQDREGGQGVERRDSWRIGKPLSRIESLREKIRQRELEKLRQRDPEDGDGSKAAADIDNAQTDVDRCEERGNEKEKEWEAACGQVETEEDAASQTSAATFDVTQEAGVLKTCPQLPVSVAHTQAARGEEPTSNTAASEVTSDSFDGSEDEDDPLKHVEEQLRRHRGRHRNSKDDQEEEGKGLFEDEEVEEYTSPLDPTQTLSPSPPHPNSLAAMSRIYNLETVGSRSGLYLRERAVDISSSVQLVKVKPLVSNSQQGDGLAFISDDVCGVQTIQRQIEQFQLKEQEALKSCMSPKKEVKGQPSSRGLLKHQVKDDAKAQEKDVETPELNSRVSPQRVCSPTSHLKQTTTTTQSFLRSQSPDNSLKPTDCAPTPAPSPSSPSPTPSPSISPSPTPSPVPFSIKSASGGPVKRGATVTITPKKPAAAGGVTGSSARSAAAGTNSAKTSSQQTQTTPAATESGKKKYPTAEEIEVIGGYQNLEKSCLVKKGGTPKRGKVCFDEDQLEQVCEYPSETFMLAFSSHPQEQLRMERLQGSEAPEDEAEAEGATVVFKGPKSVGIATAPRLRVDESCPR